MKPFFLVLIAASLVLPFNESRAETLDVDKAKQSLQRLLGEAGQALEKKKKEYAKGDESNSLIWTRSKKNFELTSEEYIGKVRRALGRAHADLTSIAAVQSSHVSRDYFKRRLESLHQQGDYLQKTVVELEKLSGSAEFASAQRNFDRSLAFFAEHLEITAKEAGL